MKITPLNIGELKVDLPLIQGGMGVGISRSRLAAAVTLEGGIGVISGVHIGFNEPDFEINRNEANKRALRNEILIAKEKTKGGVLGVNLLVAMNHYRENAEVCVKAGIDLIISGAGLPTELPGIVKGSKTKAIPIVSSGRAASVILKLWERKHAYIPDALVVEGPEAGGHLGFHQNDLIEHTYQTLSDIYADVKKVVTEYEIKAKKKISVIVAGGIYNGIDIAKYLKEGADGVQMSTRFVATYECDADIKFKEAYINASKEDILIIKSPVGLPGRAINNNFIKKVNAGNVPVTKCYACLKTCDPSNTPYCISRALIEAVKGNVDEGLIFTGSNSYKIKEIISVKELINEIITEAEAEL